MKPGHKHGIRPTLGSVFGADRLRFALLFVGLSGLAMALLGVLALRVYANHNLQLVARSLSYTVEAAVMIGDRPAANQALALIASTEEVAEAKVFNSDGTQLAHWQRDDSGLLARLQAQVAGALLNDPVSLPIIHQQQQVGHIELIGQGRNLLLFLLGGLGVILLCTLLGAVLIVHLSRRMLGDIVRPLRGLASVAHAARSERSFGRRVPQAPIAELNELGNDLNALLDELEVLHGHLGNENQPLAHQASHDSLTGLPNRAFFEGRLNRSLRNASRQQEHLALLLLGSDHLQQISDSLGHAVGDEVLISVAERVRTQLREHDLVARLGGDEFVVLLTPLQSREDAERIADKIFISMALPVQLDSGGSIITSLSVGVAFYPDDGAAPGSLLDVAAAAMYQAQRKRRSQWQMVQEVRAAVEGKEGH
ncbi:diguanylate cyclase domain-containing protein [Pseudomonas putida]